MDHAKYRMGRGILRIDLDSALRGGEGRGKRNGRVRAKADRAAVGGSQFSPSTGEAGVDRDRQLILFDGILEAISSHPQLLASTGQIELIGGQIIGARTPRGL